MAKKSKKGKNNEEQRTRKRAKPSGGVKQVVKEKRAEIPAELTADIQFSCQDCSWSYSLSQNKVCPMCKAEPELDIDFLIKVFIDFCDIKAYSIKAKEAKKVLKKYKKNYKIYPSISELWILAEKVGRSYVDKKFGEKEAEVDVSRPRVQKPKKAKDQRKITLEQRKAQIEKKRKKETSEPEKNEEQEETVTCIYCGFKNQINANKCKKCGKSI